MTGEPTLNAADLVVTGRYVSKEICRHHSPCPSMLCDALSIV
jgi:hypothetical protein